MADLSRKLSVPLDTSMFVQSHTPFADMNQYKDKTVMVVGGDEDKCRHVAEAYGYVSLRKLAPRRLAQRLQIQDSRHAR